MSFINFPNRKKRGQIGIEYLLMMGFLTFVTISTLAIAMFYSASIKDEIKISQANAFMKKIISTSETVFYAGEPSRITINAYLPEAVTNLTISGKEIAISIETNSGLNTWSYIGKVNMSGSVSISSGLKKLTFTALEDRVVIGG